jgi:hypothetical protein
MQNEHPESQFVGYVAGVLFVVCVCVALFGITLSLTSGTTDHAPPQIAAAAAGSGQG